jgi:hypothetical protein
MKTWWIKRVAGFIVAAVAMILVAGGVVMMLWNAILPDLLNVRVLGYWQAVGLLILTQILFRGFGRWKHGRHGMHGHYWKHRLEEKLAALTPEEREKFKAEWKRRCECRSNDLRDDKGAQQ